jgi:AraC-like DNA-binding protein
MIQFPASNENEVSSDKNWTEFILDYTIPGMADFLDYHVYPGVRVPEIHTTHFHHASQGLYVNERCIVDFELVYITEGEGIYRILDKEFHFKAGDLIITPPYIQHVTLPIPNPVSHYALHFDFQPRLSRKYRENRFLRSGFERLRLFCGEAIPLPLYYERFPESSIPFFESVIRNKHDLIKTGSPLALLKMIQSFYDVFTMVVEHTQNPCSGPTRLSRTLAYIEHHNTDPLTLKILADQEGYSEQYFISIFKRSYGIAPLHFVTQKRIERAKELIRTTALPLKEISFRCGYEDPYYFSRIFKKMERVSPKKYRSDYQSSQRVEGRRDH